MRGCRHSGVRIIVPARSAAQPTRITCRYVKPQRTMHPPQLMEGEALASRVLELGPVGAKFLGPVIMEVPHFASLRGKEREIVILRSDNGETWREHQIDNADELIQDTLNECFEPEGKFNHNGSVIEYFQVNRVTVQYIRNPLLFFSRSGPIGRVGRRTSLSIHHLRLSPVFRRGVAHSPRGARHRTGRGHGVEHGGATGAGRFPAGSPHQED